MGKKYFFLTILFLIISIIIALFPWIITKLEKIKYLKSYFVKTVLDEPANPFFNYEYGLSKYKEKKYVNAKAFFKRAVNLFQGQNNQNIFLSHANLGNSLIRCAENILNKKKGFR